MGPHTLTLGALAVLAAGALAGPLAQPGGQAAKHVGCYYGVWAYTRPGLGEFWPEDIDVGLCDVIYYGFGNLLNETFEVCTWDPWFDMGPPDFGEPSIKNCVQERDGDPWTPGCTTEGGLEYCHYDGIRRTLALKAINPNLKVLYSVGGWTAGGWTFSNMAQTQETRAKFIASAVHFLDYFGMDGIDLDWEYPAFDGNGGEATDPADKQHFTLLMKEMRIAFDKHSPPYLITFAAAADPMKADRAYEVDLVHPHVDWFNVMSYDYHGAWDNFTGIDQPLYGKWEESFVGHPMYQFNMHDTIMWYMDMGVPADKLSLGIHTEGKSWVLANNATEENCPGEFCPAGIYCPAISGAPNMTYSRQVGWMFYYEVLQFYYNDTIADGELPAEWSDLKPGFEHWTIYDNEHGNQDGCYLSPFAYQGRYWISYDDEFSVDLKVRYANHYNLKGAFVWDVDADNFRGLFDKKKYTILSTINDALVGGKGLTGAEILGHGHENKGKCIPEAPMCDLGFTGSPPTDMLSTVPSGGSTPDGECIVDSDCNEDDSVLCNADYSNCHYCDHGECKPGCSHDVNCGGQPMVCSAHLCDHVGDPLVTKITVKTTSCSGCEASTVEPGLKLELTGLMGLATCTTGNLDNPDQQDYKDGATAVFDNHHGIGGCEVDLFQSVDSANIAWMGPGTWTPASQDSVCVDFYGDSNPTCCCSLASALSKEDGMVPMQNCNCN